MSTTAHHRAPGATLSLSKLRSRKLMREVAGAVARIRAGLAANLFKDALHGDARKTVTSCPGWEIKPLSDRGHTSLVVRRITEVGSRRFAGTLILRGAGDFSMILPDDIPARAARDRLLDGLKAADAHDRAQRTLRHTA